MIELRADDGHILEAYEVHPEGAGSALVIVQEIFGVNYHIREVCDRFAALGFHTVAPQLFDRVERGVDYDYTPESLERGRAIRSGLDWDAAVTDLGAAVARVSSTGPVAVVGYCFGGSMAWLAAAALPVKASVGYYGGQIAGFLDRAPQVPTMLHFGEVDEAIPLSDVDAIAAAYPEVLVHVYEGAGHGFNCDARDAYHPSSAALAQERTLDFLRKHGVS